MLGPWESISLAAQQRAFPLVASETHRRAAEPERIRDTFRLTLEKSGLLMVDVSAPYLIFTDPSNLEVVSARPGSRIYWVEEPGTIEIALTASEPGVTLEAYNLRTSFVASSSPEMEDLVLIDDPPENCSLVPTSLGLPFTRSQGVIIANTTDEWDCDVLEGGDFAPGILRLESRLGTLQASLFGSTSCGSETLLGAATLVGREQILAPIFPGPFRIAVEAAQGFAGSYLLATSLLDPCHQGELDDHHEVWLCASPLSAGVAAVGEIANAHGDDVDQFTFEVAEPGEAHLDLVAPAGPFSGWRLRVSDAGGQPVVGLSGSEGGAWQATLGAGRYFVAVDRPDGSSASYELTFSILE